MMKRLFYLVLGLVVFAGCHKDSSDEEVLTLDEHRFEVSAEGETISVQVVSNVEYAVMIPDAFCSWLSEGMSKVSKTHVFAVSANDELKVREGYVLFSGGSLTDTVWVAQVPKDFTETVSGVSLEMVYVKGGTFQMGATADDDDAYDFEKPAHEVTLSDYYIGKYEVTQGLWKALMGRNLSCFEGGDSYPVDCVSWNDIQTFLTKLNQLTGRKYVLPTEAQWEYAARGGAKSKGYKYSGSDNLDEIAWYSANSERIHPVGLKKANELGIYDMIGNVCEWCSDWWYSFDYYANSPQTNPVGPETGSERVYRGSYCGDDARHCRVSYRYRDYPVSYHLNLGFRVALLP